jgi:signal transduction histidine kinase
MKLSEKIILSYVVILTLIIILEVINKTFSGYVRKDSERLSRSEELLKQSVSLQKSISNMESDFNSYFLLGDSSLATQFYISGAHFDDLYNSYSVQKIKDPDQARRYRILGAMVKKWRDSLLTPVILSRKEFLSQSSAKNESAFNALFEKAVVRQEARKELENIMRRFDVFDEHERLALDTNQRELEVSLLRNDTTSIVMALFILCIGIGITFVTARNISTRMNTMIDLAEKISLGQYNVKIDDEGTDEMSRLADALNRMTDALEDNFIKLEKSNLELKSSNRDLEQFVYSVSHDLKEPVRMVSIYSQMLLENSPGKLSKTAREYMDFAMEGANRIMKLLDGLLAYLNIARIEINSEPADLNKVVASAVQKLGEEISERKAEIKTGLMPVIEGNFDQLSLLFYHLIDNAIRYRSEDKPLVEISAKWEDHEWIFSVKDNGIGIDNQYFEKIFVIFQRLDGSVKDRRTGIGLTICKKIVELHHGRIWVSSTPGVGAVFSFSLPESQKPFLTKI